jgi:Putative Flp pilus-assembly TadE/G-like
MGSLLRAWGKLHKNQSGQIAILVAAMMTGLIGFSALAIDVGSLVSDKRDLQNAADAMALAGAQELPSQTNAGSIARTWAAKNDVTGGEIASITVQQQYLPTVPNPKITVKLHREHHTTLARVIGIDSIDLDVTASAIKTSPGGSDHVAPWSVLERFIDSWVPGDLVTLKWDANNIQNGNTMPIQIDGSGGAVYSETIEYGSDSTLCSEQGLEDGCVPDLLCPNCCENAACDSLTGDKIGPTKEGLDYIFTNTDPACQEFSQVFFPNDDGTYRINPECNPFIEGSKSSLRVIIVPVIESIGNGSSPVAIKKFALFFVEGENSTGRHSKCTGNNCEIMGHFVRAGFTTGATKGSYDSDGLIHFIMLVQ